MQCNETRVHFADYLKEQLPPAAHTRFAHHLTECASCNEELEALTEVWAKLGTIPPAESPVTAMNARFRKGLEEYRRNPESPSRKNLWYGAAAVAACLVAAVLAFGVFMRSPVEVATATVAAADEGLYRTWGGTTDLLQPGARIKLGEGLRSEGGAVLMLADNSRVEMRAKSEMSLESANDGVRIRLNKGSVIVTAAKQREGHLYVQTKDITVSVIGTVFLVNAEESGSRVAVIQGEVHVQQGETAQTLLPGEQVATASTMVVHPVAEEISWSRHATEHVALLTQLQGGPVPALPPTFEVAAIRLGDPDSTSAKWDAANERVTIDNLNLKRIIIYAFDVKDQQVVGPDTLASERFTINAKAPSGTPNSLLRPMLQQLLADRFKMTFRREMRDVQSYALQESSKGLKIKEQGAGELLSSAGIGTRTGGTGISSMQFIGTMSSLAESLSKQTGDRPVLDRTELAGRYSFMLNYVSEKGIREGVSGPSLSSALEDDLGLKLEPIRAPMEFLIIEHIEKPSEN